MSFSSPTSNVTPVVSAERVETVSSSAASKMFIVEAVKPSISEVLTQNETIIYSSLSRVNRLLSSIFAVYAAPREERSIIALVFSSAPGRVSAPLRASLISSEYLATPAPDELASSSESRFLRLNAPTTSFEVSMSRSAL